MTNFKFHPKDKNLILGSLKRFCPPSSQDCVENYQLMLSTSQGSKWIMISSFVFKFEWQSDWLQRARKRKSIKAFGNKGIIILQQQDSRNQLLQDLVNQPRWITHNSKGAYLLYSNNFFKQTTRIFKDSINFNLSTCCLFAENLNDEGERTVLMSPLNTPKLSFSPINLKAKENYFSLGYGLMTNSYVQYQ